MIEFQKAYEIVISSFQTLGVERVDFIDSIGCVLAEDIISDIDMPPFDKSAMDGYACRLADLNLDLDVIELIPAGKAPSKTISTGECAKIMTGAMVPEGADCVIMIEETQEIAKNKIRFTGTTTKPNITFRAVDVQKGDTVLKCGTLLQPQHIAVLASVGAVKPSVYKKPTVGVISTGDELVEPQDQPSISQIRNSNGFQIIAQIKKMNANPVYFGIAKDTQESTKNIIEKAIAQCDVIILSGGVSMGDFDYVPEVLKNAGVDILFDSIAVQPGKPTTFGRSGNKFFFGLPGNPVSSFNQFELLAKPLIYRMMGYEFNPLTVRLPMGIAYNREKASRLSWIPVVISDQGTVLPVDYHGSAHIYALSSAHGIVPIAIGQTELKKGELVDVRQI
jgi:molybdopterin molybdotransferase